MEGSVRPCIRLSILLHTLLLDERHLGNATRNGAETVSSIILFVRRRWLCLMQDNVGQRGASPLELERCAVTYIEMNQLALQATIHHV